MESNWSNNSNAQLSPCLVTVKTCFPVNNRPSINPRVISVTTLLLVLIMNISNGEKKTRKIKKKSTSYFRPWWMHSTFYYLSNVCHCFQLDLLSLSLSSVTKTLTPLIELRTLPRSRMYWLFSCARQACKVSCIKKKSHWSKTAKRKSIWLGGN